MNRIKLVGILVTLSLIFLGFHLYSRADALTIPPVVSWRLVILSFLPLFAGFIWNVYATKVLLGKFFPSLSFIRVLAGNGTNVFGKYIPGKIWAILGNTLYLSPNDSRAASSISVLLLQSQIISTWAALLLGVFGIRFLERLPAHQWLPVVGVAVVLASAFIPAFYSLTEKAYLLIRRKPITLARLSFATTVTVIPLFMVTWLLWGAGFHLLSAGMVSSAASWHLLFWFPVGCTIGGVAVIIPGGIGVREGVLVGLLTLSNVPLPAAITIAAASRLWFLVGELFIFLAGLLAVRANKSTAEALSKCK